MTFKLAFRNVLRHRTRSLISIIAIASGVVSLILAGGFITDTVRAVREAYIRDLLGHIRLYKPGFRKEGLLHPFDFMISAPAHLAQSLSTVPFVRTVAPRLTFGALLSTGESTMPVMAEGLDPVLERRAHDSIHIERGQNLANRDGFDVVLGKGIAEAIGSRPGDPLTLVTSTRSGGLNALDVTVKGSFGTADKAYDDHVVRLPLTTAQRLLKTDDVQTLVIFLDQTNHTEKARQAIEHLLRDRHLDYEVKPWYELEEADYILKVIAFYKRIFLVLKLIIIAVVTLSIANTMNMAVLERIGEIGTLRAMGTRQRDVAKLFLAEGLLLGILGGAVGILLGSVLALLISQIGIPMPTAPGSTAAWIAHIAWDPGVIAFSFSAALLTSVLSAALPALKASRLEIGAALRHNL